MTTEEIESYLKLHHPTQDWVVSDKLGIGLPMLDGVMLFVRADGATPIDRLAEQLIAMTAGKPIP